MTGEDPWPLGLLKGPRGKRHFSLPSVADRRGCRSRRRRRRRSCRRWRGSGRLASWWVDRPRRGASGRRSSTTSCRFCGQGKESRVCRPDRWLGYLRADKPGVLEPPPEGWTITATSRHRLPRLRRDQGPPSALPRSAARWFRSPRSRCWRRSCGRITRAVAAIADARKGERLIMVTDKHGATRSEFIAYARGKHASELTFPAEVVILEKLPMLGSGKVDQLAIDKFVREKRRRRRPRRSDPLSLPPCGGG